MALARGILFPMEQYGNIVRRREAVSTGEFRPPKKGEYYISGALPMAYKAPDDLSTSYNIAIPNKNIKERL